jgi:hypothetical protein
MTVLNLSVIFLKNASSEFFHGLIFQKIIKNYQKHLNSQKFISSTGLIKFYYTLI